MAREYTVLTIDQLTRRSDTGGFESYYRHRIKTHGGVILSVDVDAKDFTPEKVAPILAAAAKNADEIRKL